MDDFKREQHKACGPGGPKCPCCNDYHKHHLNKLARVKIKRMVKEAARKAIEDINN